MSLAVRMAAELLGGACGEDFVVRRWVLVLPVSAIRLVSQGAGALTPMHVLGRVRSLLLLGGVMLVKGIRRRDVLVR